MAKNTPEGVLPTPEVEEAASLDTAGLCLLSLDGGGVRGLSSLFILKALMMGINDERKIHHLPPLKPCDIFDLIGGTSTGGLIAIMLGRLEMTVEESITAYQTLIKSVFEKKKKKSSSPLAVFGKVEARFSSKVLEDAIKQVIRSRKGISVDEAFEIEEDPEKPRKCKVFVCARSKETGDIVRLKSYRLSGELSDNPKIWEAALATSAAPTFFDPARIGDLRYVDGALGSNNPVNQVEDEASNIWCRRSRQLRPSVKCFVSIGTGNPGKDALQDRVLKFLAESMIKIATETRQTAEQFMGRWLEEYNKSYFRFNVEQGLQGIGLAEYDQVARIQSSTYGYLNEHIVRSSMENCVGNLRQKKYTPGTGICIEGPTSQEHQRRNMTQDRRVHTAEEISELIELGAGYLKIPRDRIRRDHLFEAKKYFSAALKALDDQEPAVQPKMFVQVYQNLMSVSIRLSHFLDLPLRERMHHVNEAERFVNLALENALKSVYPPRIAQMRFYMACVQARKVCLEAEIEGIARPAFAKREEALEAISTTLTDLKKAKVENTRKFEDMAREYSQHIENGV